MKQIFTRKDLVLILSVVLLAGGFFLWNRLSDKPVDKKAVIKMDGQIIEEVSLSENKEISINDGSNIIVVKDGAAYMREADCPDQICVHQGEISRNNESIICLPNEVVVIVEDNSESSFDVIAK